MIYYNTKLLLLFLIISFSLLNCCNNGNIEKKDFEISTIRNGIIVNLMGVGCSGCEEALFDLLQTKETKMHFIIPDNKLHHVKSIKKIKNVSYDIINTTSEYSISTSPYIEFIQNEKKIQIEIKTSEMEKIKMRILNKL